ncbi:MAG TPA: NAD(P)H-dependent oxidoreductase [Methylovirgula sp.]|nr:NAD(P)H-dependent oxidoreductase [Methylovirgula sp.]
MKLLYIDSSILGPNSVSRQVTAAIVDQLRRTYPGLDVLYRDLSTSPLAHVTLAHLPNAHPLSALAASSDKSEAALSDKVLDEFLAADIVVIGAPMYNFTIPSQLKAWIDRIIVPGKTFAYGETGVVGLASEKRVIIAISRGGFYGAETPMAAFEHLETYLKSAFGFIGVKPDIVVAEGLQAGPEQRKSAIETALNAVSQLRAA